MSSAIGELSNNGENTKNSRAQAPACQSPTVQAALVRENRNQETVMVDDSLHLPSTSSSSPSSKVRVITPTVPSAIFIDDDEETVGESACVESEVVRRNSVCEIVGLCESDSENNNDNESDLENNLENGDDNDDDSEMEINDNDDDDDETIFDEDDQEMPFSVQHSEKAEEDEDQNMAEDDSNEFEDREALKRSYVERADEIDNSAPATTTTSRPINGYSPTLNEWDNSTTVNELGL
ncbi:phosphopantothenoylcysteine decarboxylase subunit VHS3-like isoform X2 [Belonocnema kinseyi]|uniref:phosphopantothenoylcysteine decarboxylase subunit VHS3-like isoform X2 n=1 Tax=Belonocnema kinseyi TaxID=2817044 RepID=UPI00143D3E8D|nr:phosphopantothenoylcysteine decarboxylase subunit VHS3-like isoform X2 [Belonocnema kinseyi]